MFSTRHVLLWFFLVPAWNRITSIQLAWTSPRRYWDEKHKCWIEANIFWTQILLIGALNMGGVIVNTLLLSSYDTCLYGSAESAKWPHTRKSKWHTTGKLWDFFDVFEWNSTNWVPRDVNFEQFANLVAEKRSKCCYCFRTANSGIDYMYTCIIHPAPYKNRSCTNRNLFRVLYRFGGFGNVYFVSYCGLHETPVGLSAFAQTKERK